MNKFWLGFLTASVLASLVFVWLSLAGVELIKSPVVDFVSGEKPLTGYTIDALSQTKFEASEITLGRVLNETANFTSYVFYFTVNPSTHSVNTQGRTEWNRSTTGSGPRRVSGLVNIPKLPGVYPVIVMLRGYVDREIYTTGTGTQRVGEVLSQNGFVTMAPDFLGYGESDKPSDNPMEERFGTYVTALTLLESVKNLNNAFNSYNQNSCHSEPSTSVILRTESEESKNRSFASAQDDSGCVDIVAKTNPSKVGIWGHSNGGQIALTILEITKKSYPTVLWAPVSKPFPYSVLYYTDDFDDRGKMLRRALGEFEKDYDVELYNLTNYFDRINASLSIHQGTADDSVPQKWSDQLLEELGKLKKDVDYFTYLGADHNLAPGGWNLAVIRALEFYRAHFKGTK